LTIMAGTRKDRKKSISEEKRKPGFFQPEILPLILISNSVYALLENAFTGAEAILTEKGITLPGSRGQNLHVYPAISELNVCVTLTGPRSGRLPFFMNVKKSL